jgi:hypothetical protein
MITNDDARGRGCDKREKESKGLITNKKENDNDKIS